MKHYLYFCLLFGPWAILPAQNIGDFTSVQPGVQDAMFHIPATHTFQVIIRHGDALTSGGTLPDNTDFTGYVPINGRSDTAYLSINSEANPGGNTVLDIDLDPSLNQWITLASTAIDFSGVGGTRDNCSGAITPWGTVLSCEEEIVTTDANMDGHFDIGWTVEIDPQNKTVIDKRWAMGCFVHENAAVHSNQRTVYQGADVSIGYLFKFVATTAGDLSAGNLYVYSGSKSGTGNWLLLNNSTPTDRNTTNGQATLLGATVFDGIEDVEIGPDGRIYFAVKGENRVYRFQDSDPITGTTVSNFETFVGNTSYLIDYGSGTTTEAWGYGNDNMAFDGDGNLWVMQDGGNDYIWVVKAGHTQANPLVEIFARTPAGSEPTGITFSPDYKYLFMSIQHPSSANSASTQYDAFCNLQSFDRDLSLVIARDENLGPNPAPGPCGTILSSQALTSFTAEVVEGGIQLEWALEEDQPDLTYIVERRNPNTSFSYLHDIASNAANVEATAYDWTDKNPFSGVNFYRLKIVGPNGSFQYSEIVQAIWDDDREIIISPSPVSPGQHVRIFGVAGNSSIEFQLVTTAGTRIVYDAEIPIVNGGLTWKVPASLPRGVYLISLSSGERYVSQKILIR